MCRVVRSGRGVLVLMVMMVVAYIAGVVGSGGGGGFGGDVCGWWWVVEV